MSDPAKKMKAGVKETASKCWDDMNKCTPAPFSTVEKCCVEQDGKIGSPHLKDENGNYVKHVHWEDTWAWGILKATLASKPLCKKLIKISRGWAADDVKICPSTADGKMSPRDTEWADAEWNTEKSEMNFPSWDGSKTVASKSCDSPLQETTFKAIQDKIKKAAKDCHDALNDDNQRSDKCLTLFKLGVETIADGKGLYAYFDGTYPKTERGYKAERLQARMQGEDSMFSFLTAMDEHVKNADGRSIGNYVESPTTKGIKTDWHSTSNYQKKGRAIRCKGWYNFAVAGDAPARGSTFRVEQEGGLSSQVLGCKISTIDMQYQEGYSMGKNNGCRGTASVAGVFRACEAPFVMGVSGTILHQMRTAYGANVQMEEEDGSMGVASPVDFDSESIMILIAGLILGGHHTMTELGITGMYFSKWQEAPGNKVPPPDAKKCNDPKDKANEAEDAASMAPSNGVEYTAYVKRFFALGSALFGAEFDTQVKSIADVYGTNWPKVEGAETPMLPAPETVDALKKECVGKTLYDLVGDLVPFWTEGQSPVGRSNSCTDKTSARSPNAKSATEMKATALQQSKQEQDPASLN